MAAVTLDGVAKRFGEVLALSGLSLSVRDGEFLVMLGPSGCGKSTVLRLIAGLDDVTAGTVSINGRDIGMIPTDERDIAMVFQNYALYPHMTVRQNIEFPLVCHRTPRPDRVRLVAEVARTLDIDDLVDRRPAQLSGGQRQRVALARALVRRPSVFLLDEPLSNLDAQLRVQTRAQLIELHASFGTTTVYVTHDQVEAMTMADRIAIVDQGRVQQIDRPQVVYDRPDTAFVAGFIGNPPMNCVPATIQVNADGTVLARTAGGATTVPPEAAAVLADAHGRAVTVGIRPEHLERSGDGPLTATLIGAEFLGSERHLICRLDGGSQMIIREPSDKPMPPTGSAVRLTAAAEDVHVFDADTGVRVPAP
jgi:ABC-type sugar transport system ATPase subunit